MAGNQGASEQVQDLFRNFNFLSIKHSVRQLLQLPPEMIEEFVARYSALIIFLLNILDQERSQTLLRKLTDSSIIYVVEEELRFILIQEFSRLEQGEDSETILITMLDRLEESNRENRIDFELDRYLKLLLKTKIFRKKTNMAYLDTLPEKRRLRILNMLLERNAVAALGMLPFVSAPVASNMVEVIIQTDVKVLKFIPGEILMFRFQKAGTDMMDAEVIRHLPAEIRERFENYMQVRNELESRLNKIADLKKKVRSGRADSKEALDLTFRMLKEVDSELQDLFLDEIRRRRLFGENEIYLMNYMIKGN